MAVKFINILFLKILIILKKKLKEAGYYKKNQEKHDKYYKKDYDYDYDYY